MTDRDPVDDGPADDEPAAGQTIINVSFAGTGALLVAALVGIASPASFGGHTAVVSGVLFAVGVVAFLWGYATGVVRSREDAVSLGGLFFLSGTAPAQVRFRLRAAFIAQILIAVVAAAVRPYTSVAFVVLAPLFGLGLLAMWGARYGTFPAREPRR